MLVELPQDSSAYPFTTELEIRMSDTSGGIHLGNHQVVCYMNEAVVRLYQAMGFKGPLIGSVSYIQRDMAIAYYSEGSLGDIVEIGVAVEKFEDTRYTLIFRLHNKTTGREVAHIRALFVSFDYKERKKAAVPKEMIEAYEKLSAK